MTDYNNPKNPGDPDDHPLDPNQVDYRDRLEYVEAQYQREKAAENSGAVQGVLVGGLVSAIVLCAAAIYFWTKPAPNPTIISTPASPSASTAAKPEPTTKIIERTIEKSASSAPSTKVKVVEVPKPILVPGETKTIEVPKPILVPGETKTIEVPKAYPVPSESSATELPQPYSTAPSKSQNSASPKASLSPSSTPAAPKSQNSAPIDTPLPTTPNNGNN
jgi:hypothetical protein